MTLDELMHHPVYVREAQLTEIRDVLTAEADRADPRRTKSSRHFIKTQTVKICDFFPAFITGRGINRDEPYPPSDCVARLVALAFFISGAKASPHFQAPMFSPLSMQAGLRCGLVNGHIECGNTNGGGKHQETMTTMTTIIRRRRKITMRIAGCQNALSKGQFWWGLQGRI